jgi:hypothetical protein
MVLSETLKHLSAGRTMRTHLIRTATLVGALTMLPALAHAQAKGTAVFTGTVVDSVRKPIASVEVSFPALAISKLTDDQGAFRLTDIPAGVQRVLIRRIGYGQLDTSIVFADNQTVERRVTLGRVVMLDSVVVAAAKTDAALADFEENRHRGFGRFIGPEEMAKKEGQTLSSVLQQLEGLAIVRGSGGQSWILTKRGPSSRCPPPRPGNNYAEAQAQQEITDNCLRSERVFYVPDPVESKQGMKRACYALVYLDRAVMNGGTPTIPFDANSLATIQLDAVEWYETMGNTPPRYSSRDTRCGLLVLHSRQKR